MIIISFTWTNSMRNYLFIQNQTTSNKVILFINYKLQPTTNCKQIINDIFLLTTECKSIENYKLYQTDELNLDNSLATNTKEPLLITAARMSEQRQTHSDERKRKEVKFHFEKQEVSMKRDTNKKQNPLHSIQRNLEDLLNLSRFLT